MGGADGGKRRAGDLQCHGPALAAHHGWAALRDPGGDARRLDVRFTWASKEFLAANKVEPFQEMPLWLPPGSDGAAILETDVRKAVAAGLTYRPLAVTARETLE